MDILSLLGKHIESFVNDVLTPETFQVGRTFEDYARKQLFIPSYYVEVERTPEYNRFHKDYNALKPDFTFYDRWEKREFYVEVKFRAWTDNGKVRWCTDEQLRRYKQYAGKKPFFLLLGIGEDPMKPAKLALIPLEKACYTELYLRRIYDHEIYLDKPITSKMLWNR